MTVVTASVELLVWQSPGPDGVSEPEEEDVFEHLDGGEERVQLGALYLLPPDGHLANGQLQHLAHLNIATVSFWSKQGDCSTAMSCLPTFNISTSKAHLSI